jgi:hypothetical protein
MDSLDSTLLGQVEYPLYSPSSLESAHGTFKFLTRFDFRDGARFLCDTNLTVLLNSLGTARNPFLVSFPILYFTSKSKVDSGERLQ